MISGEEIKKLASLARIKIDEEEVESLKGEIGAILDYVKSIDQFHTESGLAESDIAEGQLHNVMRADENPNEAGKYSKELIDEFPRKDGNYLKVKKIL
jgi:aspartyl-tRNA(Asn)/glutamyl-tRNA(Gln) amidotransferase subunit C